VGKTAGGSRVENSFRDGPSQVGMKRADMPGCALVRRGNSSKVWEGVRTTRIRSWPGREKRTRKTGQKNVSQTRKRGGPEKRVKAVTWRAGNSTGLSRPGKGLPYGLACTTSKRIPQTAHRLLKKKRILVHGRRGVLGGRAWGPAGSIHVCCQPTAEETGPIQPAC